MCERHDDEERCARCLLLMPAGVSSACLLRQSGAHYDADVESAAARRARSRHEGRNRPRAIGSAISRSVTQVSKRAMKAISVGPLLLLAATTAAPSNAHVQLRTPRPLVARRPGSPNAELSAAIARPAASASQGRGMRPSFLWALLSNWLYFLSLALNAINMSFMVRLAVNGNLKPSAASIALSGNVEAVDKLLTFLGVGYLCGLSDALGRKPLMLWSALGFAMTNFLQAASGGSRVGLYLADIIDGCSSCMTPVCQAYVVDCSMPASTATNLGLFQGLSIGGAFIIAFPIGGLLGAKFGPRMPLLIAGVLQLLNALVIALATPESNPAARRAGKMDLRGANPLGGLRRLFFHGATLRAAAASYFLVTLARNSLDAQFVNYASVRFGWSQQQTGPVMVLVGLMLAIVPRLMVPLLGLRLSLLSGLLVFAMGLVATALAPTPFGFVGGIAIVAFGCVILPALQAILASLAPVGERGALLGALGSLTELTSAIGSTMYARLLAHFSSPAASVQVPGMHFLVAAALLLVAFGLNVFSASSA